MSQREPDQRLRGDRCSAGGSSPVQRCARDCSRRKYRRYASPTSGLARKITTFSALRVCAAMREVVAAGDRRRARQRGVDHHHLVVRVGEVGIEPHGDAGAGESRDGALRDLERLLAIGDDLDHDAAVVRRGERARELRLREREGEHEDLALRGVDFGNELRVDRVPRREGDLDGAGPREFRGGSCRRRAGGRRLRGDDGERRRGQRAQDHSRRSRIAAKNPSQPCRCG